MEEIGALVIAARQGDLAAFGRLVARFQGMAVACAFGIVGDRQLAEDAAQEAFVEAYLQLPTLREPAAFPGWFRRIVLKHGDRLIRGKRVATVSLEEQVALAGRRDDPETNWDQYEMQSQVRGAIETLPAHERTVISHFYLLGHSHQEIADFLELPVTTIKKRLHDSRKRLKRQIGDPLHEPPSAQANRVHRGVAFFLAIRAGNVAEVRTLLADDPGLVHLTEHHDESALRQGVGPAVNAYAPLHLAAMHGNSALVALFLEAGAEVDAQTASGETAWHQATLLGHQAVAEQLLAHGASVNLPTGTGLTALHRVVSRGDRGMAAWLLAHGADPHARDKAGRTPLHWAALKGLAPLVSLLLAHGADISCTDRAGRTPYQTALTQGHRALAPLFEVPAHPDAPSGPTG